MIESTGQGIVVAIIYGLLIGGVATMLTPFVGQINPWILVIVAPTIGITLTWADYRLFAPNIRILTSLVWIFSTLIIWKILTAI